MPQRVQLKRTKGWRMPPNTVKVDRSTRWGNPAVAGKVFDGEFVETAIEAVTIFRDLYVRCRDDMPDPSLLRGKNLACWCPICDQHRDGKPAGVECSECAPCHADVLLGLANE